MLDRREFLHRGIEAVGSASLLSSRLWSFEPVSVTNPLGSYPARDWEQVYRDQYRVDGAFSWICAPNDTHNCLLKAFVRNGIVLRSESPYECGRVKDLYGNSATAHWNPRSCAKGESQQRRLYGPYRLKQPLIRKGWKEWADAGFPSLSDNPQLRDKYRFTSRGTDTFVPLTWDEMYRYLARAVLAIARTYSGEEGARRLRADGYEPEMIEECHGAGTRTFKLRGGMGLLGVMGKYGLYRWANMLALVDHLVRGVPPEKALGGRLWSNYTWHGDQAPGHPFVHGLQAADCDLNDMRHAKLHIQCGKNLVENKMTDAHWFIEMIERGGRIVVISPEYSPPATKADYWIHVRPGCTDTALFLGIARYMIEQGWYKPDFIKAYTDFPLLVRTDTLERLRAIDVFPNYKPGLVKDGPSYTVQHLTDEQYRRLRYDFVIFDEKEKKPMPITRDQIGKRMTQAGLSPALSWKGSIRLVDGTQVEVMTIWDAYQIHLKDYDLDTVAEITGADKDLIIRLAKDIWETTSAGHAVAIHIGEGINHWFHATLANRAQYLPIMLTGQIGKPGAGCFTWAGNYKAALFQGAGDLPGFLGWIAEDPFAPNLDKNADGKDVTVVKTTKDEEPAYWNHGERPLIVQTPKYGRRCFTGKTHMPTPTKFLWFANVNLFNNAKHAYDMLFNVNPHIDCIVAQDVEMTSSCEYSDLILPANTWMEFQTYEITASCSNPFLYIWKGGIPPVHNTRDDVHILAEAAAALTKETGDKRFADYWHFILADKENGVKVYIQRLLDASVTTRGYKVDDILNGTYGEPGAALMLFRTYPRIPFYENIHDDLPFWTDTGRLNAYCDIPEAITFGENFIVHREGPEATPYLPNVIVSTNPLVRPDDFGIAPTAMSCDERTLRNIKLPWKEVVRTKNPLWEQGFRFYLLTPKTRHRVHSSWSTVDWHNMLDSNFGDPYRTDRRLPFFGDHQLHMNPEDARELGINDGDYVYVDANPEDRPFRGWQKDPRRARVARLMLRVTYNSSYPRGVVMTKHAPFIATEKTVAAHEDPEGDGRCRSKDTGYQANLRYGAQQSCTRNWLMPMHQTDSLFHKAKVKMAFIFGGEADNHAVNTAPKETLVRITKAEDGGPGGKGLWEPATRAFGPTATTPENQLYVAGQFVTVIGSDRNTRAQSSPSPDTEDPHALGR